MTINQETVEIMDKSMLFRELLENAGIGSVSTKAQGIVSNSASYQFIKDSVISGTIINCKLLSNTGEVYSGGFLITSFESLGEYRDWETRHRQDSIHYVSLHEYRQQWLSCWHIICGNVGGYVGRTCLAI